LGHSPLDRAHGRASTLLEGYRAQVSSDDVRVLSSGRREIVASAMIRSSVYIWSAAALETFVAETLSGLVSGINGAAVQYQNLRLTLLAMACTSHFDAVRDRKGIKGWSSRARLMASVQQSDVAVLVDNRAQLPMDGKTIRPEHFEVIWEVFGLPGDPMPSPRHRIRLIELADGRNQLAHGEEDPFLYGRRKSAPELMSALNAWQDIIDHVYLCSDEYLRQRLYHR
jgi:hypothetical protein